MRRGRGLFFFVPLLIVSAGRAAPASREGRTASDGEGEVGAFPDNGILEKHSTQLCVALFNAAHSLYSLNRCLETGSCHF